MIQLTQYVFTHGALLLFALVVLEQAGIPLPSAPVLLSVASFATSGGTSVTETLIAAATACLVADGFWYTVGRSSRSHFLLPSAATNDWKKRVLGFVDRHGTQALLPAKYAFSSNLLSLLAGRRRTPLAQFLAFDTVASVVWSGGYISLGYLLRNQLHWTLAHTLSPLVLLFGVATVWSLATLLIRRSDKLGSLRDLALGARAFERFATNTFSLLLDKGYSVAQRALEPHLAHHEIASRLGSDSKLRRCSFAFAAALIVLICPPLFARQALAPAAPQSQNQQGGGQDSGTATVVGTVIGIDDAPVSGAAITLEATDSTDVRTAETNDSGFFKIAGIPPDHSYQVTVNASGFMQWESPLVVLQAGEFKILDIDKLAIEEVQTSITVRPEDSEEIATEQVKAEEKQRGFLIIPNFYAAYTPNPEPLTAKLKFSLAFRVARDPFTFGGVTALAGFDQAADSPKFVEGARGYGERWAANYANAFTDVMLDGAVLPTVLHQDPRYFYQGTGTKKSRTLHVISSLFVAKGDNGRLQPNYSSLGGDLASSAIANLYYPKSNRGAGLVFGGLGVDTAVHLAIRLLDEFAFRPPNVAPDSGPWNSNPHL